MAVQDAHIFTDMPLCMGCPYPIRIFFYFWSNTAVSYFGWRVQPEVDRLANESALLVKFVQLRHIRDVVDLRTIDFDDYSIHHDDSTIVVSLKVRSFFEDEGVTPAVQAPFTNDVRAFYCAVARWSQSFCSVVLRDLGVLDPAAHVNLMYEPIVRLAARFAPTSTPNS